MKKYRYKPKNADEIEKEMNSIQLNISQHQTLNQSFGLKSAEASIMMEKFDKNPMQTTSITIQCLDIPKQGQKSDP